MSRARLGGTDALGLRFDYVFTISSYHPFTTCAGAIPAALGALSGLRELVLGDNQLTGEENVTFHRCIVNLKRLCQVLCVSGIQTILVSRVLAGVVGGTYRYDCFRRGRDLAVC